MLSAFYVPYTGGRYTKLLGFLKNAPSLLLLHPFSKDYCIPGMDMRLCKIVIKKKEFYHSKKQRGRKKRKKLSIDSSWSLPEEVL
jgi:hypothetical protein